MPQQYQTKDKSVTLYLNGIAHVATSVEVEAQKTVQIIGIAPQFDLETLHPILGSKEVKILEARVLEPTTLAEIAKSKIGQEAHDKEANEDVRVFGVEGNNQLLVKSSKGVYTKPLTAFEYKSGEDVREKKAVELRLEGLKEGKLALSYLTKGVTLTPHYNINLIKEKEENKLVLTAEVEVENRTGKAYEEIELEAIPGNVGIPFLPAVKGGPRIRRLAGAVMVGELHVEEVTAFEEGGQIGYAFGRKNLPEGHSKFIVSRTHGLDYQIIYRANLHGSRAQINAALRFKTPLTLPSGSAAVYSEKTKPGDKQELIERYEGGGAINNPVLKDKDVNITLREPDTLEMKIKQIGEIRLVPVKQGIKTIYALEKEFQVNAANSGQNDVIVESYLHLNETERLLESSLQKHEESSGAMARWDVSVKAGKETAFSYKIQDLKFKPASREEAMEILEMEKKLLSRLFNLSKK